MTRFALNRTLFDARITAQVLVLEEGVQINLFGGTKAHIGAVSAVSPAGELRTWQFPAHKEGILSEQWAQALSQAGFRPAVVSAGIHYDHLSSEGIQAVVELTEQLLSQTLEALAQASGQRRGENAP